MNKRKRVNRIPAAIQCHGRPGACPACTVDYIANDWDAKIWHNDMARDVVHTERKFPGPVAPRNALPNFTEARYTIRWIWFPLHQQKRFS